jgi:hypothetical protein
MDIRFVISKVIESAEDKPMASAKSARRLRARQARAKGRLRQSVVRLRQAAVAH